MQIKLDLETKTGATDEYLTGKKVMVHYCMHLDLICIKKCFIFLILSSKSGTLSNT